MNREIKFRGQKQTNGVWVYGSLVMVIKAYGKSGHYEEIINIVNTLLREGLQNEIC